MSEGVSWLHDRLRADLKERNEQILQHIGKGLAYHEYITYVGRLRENERQQNDLAELFKDFYQAEDEDV